MKTFKDLRLKINSTRNELYNSLHSGEVSAFELTVLIGKHLKKLDDLSHEIDVELQSSQTGEEETVAYSLGTQFVQTRELTDEEWLKLPKEEILQLYKNCYQMLQNYIGLSGEKVIDISSFTATKLPNQSPSEDKIMSAEEIFKKHHPLIYGMGTGEFKNNFISAMKEYASQFSQSQRKVVTDSEIEKVAIIEANQLVGDVNDNEEVAFANGFARGFVRCNKYLRDILSK